MYCKLYTENQDQALSKVHDFTFAHKENDLNFEKKIFLT